MIKFVPVGTKTLIDIGCGDGRFGELVKQTLPTCEVWGLEPTVASVQAATRCDRLIIGPLADVPELPTAYFDVVTMNDVLEHLPDPEPALEIVKRILKPGGQLNLSLPNVSYYLNIRDLVFKNDWEYQDFGVLDRTHLKFYTQKSAVRMLERNGFTVTKSQGINAPKLKLHYATLFAILPLLTKPMRFPQFAIVSSYPN